MGEGCVSVYAYLAEGVTASTSFEHMTALLLSPSIG